MKKQSILFVIFLSIFITINISAGDPVKKHSKISDRLIEENYINGINSGNLGLRVSSAYYLGEMKSEKAVIPLIRMLRSEENEGAKIMAALSLVKIEDTMGLYMVAQQGVFSDSKRVRRMCNRLYNAYKVTEAINDIKDAVSLAGLVK